MPAADDALAPFLLMRAFRGLVDQVHADLADHGFPGIRAQHCFALQAVGDGCTSVELGARLGVSKQAAAKTAASLVELGLLVRDPDPADRRKRTLLPTQRARTLLEISGRSFRRGVAQWRADVGSEAVDVTLATLARAGTGGRGDTDVSDWL